MGAMSAEASAAPLGTADPIRLRSDVTHVRREGSQNLLVSADGRAIRVSATVGPILPALREGTTIDALVRTLAVRYPNAQDVEPRVRDLVAVLARSSLLDASERADDSPRKLVVLDVDSLALTGACFVSKVPAPLRFVLALTAALVALFGPHLARRALGDSFAHALLSREGVAAVFYGFLVAVPLHEASHAVACRLTGSRVRSAGIARTRWGLPLFYVDTSLAYAVASRAKRGAIAAAGPLCDATLAGTLGVTACIAGRGSHVATFAGAAIFLHALFVIAALNPFGATDGSHVLQAILADDLARRGALLGPRSRWTTTRAIVAYRGACVAYCAACLVIMFLLFL